MSIPGKSPEKVEHHDPIDDIKAERQRLREYQEDYMGAQNMAWEVVQKALAYTFEDMENIMLLLKKEVVAGRSKLTGCKPIHKGRYGCPGQADHGMVRCLGEGEKIRCLTWKENPV